MTDNPEKLTEKDFHDKLNIFYNQIVQSTGAPIQTGRLNVNNNAQRIEYVFISPLSGQRCFLWWNRLTGLVGWSMIQPVDIV